MYEAALLETRQVVRQGGEAFRKHRDRCGHLPAIDHAQ